MLREEETEIERDNVMRKGEVERGIEQVLLLRSEVVQRDQQLGAQEEKLKERDRANAALKLKLKNQEDVIVGLRSQLIYWEGQPACLLERPSIQDGMQVEELPSLPFVGS